MTPQPPMAARLALADRHLLEGRSRIETMSRLVERVAIHRREPAEKMLSLMAGRMAVYQRYRDLLSDLIERGEVAADLANSASDAPRLASPQAAATPQVRHGKVRVVNGVRSLGKRGGSYLIRWGLFDADSLEWIERPSVASDLVVINAILKGEAVLTSDIEGVLGPRLSVGANRYGAKILQVDDASLTMAALPAIPVDRKNR